MANAPVKDKPAESALELQETDETKRDDIQQAMPEDSAGDIEPSTSKADDESKAKSEETKKDSENATQDTSKGAIKKDRARTGVTKKDSGSRDDTDSDEETETVPLVTLVTGPRVISIEEPERDSEDVETRKPLRLSLLGRLMQVPGTSRKVQSEENVRMSELMVSEGACGLSTSTSGPSSPEGLSMENLKATGEGGAKQVKFRSKDEVFELSSIGTTSDSSWLNTDQCVTISNIISDYAWKLAHACSGLTTLCRKMSFYARCNSSAWKHLASISTKIENTGAHILTKTRGLLENVDTVDKELLDIAASARKMGGNCRYLLGDLDHAIKVVTRNGEISPKMESTMEEIKETIAPMREWMRELAEYLKKLDEYLGTEERVAPESEPDSASSQSEGAAAAPPAEGNITAAPDEEEEEAPAREATRRPRVFLSTPRAATREQKIKLIVRIVVLCTGVGLLVAVGMGLSIYYTYNDDEDRKTEP